MLNMNLYIIPTFNPHHHQKSYPVFIILVLVIVGDDVCVYMCAYVCVKFEYYENLQVAITQLCTSEL